MRHQIRVRVGKPGLYGHDRGAKVVAAALRDAGLEVSFTGLHRTPEQISEAAVQEEVDVVALSILSGGHMTLFPEVAKLMRVGSVGRVVAVRGAALFRRRGVAGGRGGCGDARLAALGVGAHVGPAIAGQDRVESCSGVWPTSGTAWRSGSAAPGAVGRGPPADASMVGRRSRA